MKASASRSDVTASAPNSPGMRGTPKRATATAANMKMKKMAIKNEDEEDAFDGEDEDFLTDLPGSKATTPKKTHKARVRSAPTTPMSQRYV